MRRATSHSTSQSARASPGAGKNARWREMRRSEFVTVPSFSPQPSAGSSTSACAFVSDCALMSDTTTSSHLSSARRTWSASGMLTSGLVAMIHTALTLPASIAWNRSTAFRPGLFAMRGESQKVCTVSRCSGLSSSRCAASMLARPPTSRPPMAFGWPVSENGPMPGWPMRPVARWQLMMLLTLSVPQDDWFTPCEKAVTTLRVAAKAW